MNANWRNGTIFIGDCKGSRLLCYGSARPSQGGATPTVGHDEAQAWGN